jgi:hypothetical protein
MMKNIIDSKLAIPVDQRHTICRNLRHPRIFKPELKKTSAKIFIKPYILELSANI